MCNFYFFFQQTMFQRFKKMIIVEIIEMSKTQEKKSTLIELIDSNEHEDRLLTRCRKLEEENRLLTECRLISTNKKIDD